MLAHGFRYGTKNIGFQNIREDNLQKEQRKLF